MDKTKSKSNGLKKLLCAIVLILIVSVSMALFGCATVLLQFSAKQKICRIIFTDNVAKYYGSDVEPLEWKDYDVDDVPSCMSLYKNTSGNGYDIIYAPGKLTTNDDGRPMQYNFNQWFRAQINCLSFDGSYSIYLNNKYSFSGISSVYPLGGTTYYPFSCSNSECENANVTIYETDSSSRECEYCHQTMSCSNVDGVFFPDGTYHNQNYAWASGVLGTSRTEPLAFDELVIDGYDFYSYNYLIKYQNLTGLASGAEKDIDMDDYSYMFSDLPCKKITIKNISGLSATGAKFSSRDEYVTDRINNYIIKLDEFKDFNNGTVYTIDSFVDAINSKASSDDDKLTKQQVIITGVTEGYFDCPITVSEYLLTTEQKTLDELVDAVNADPSTLKLSAKPDGSPYTKDEVSTAILQQIYAPASMMIVPVVKDDELDKFYSEKTRYINISHMFENCKNLETVDFGNLFENVTPTNISYMFANCPSLKNIDLTSLNTQYVTDMSNMFGDAGATNYKNRDEQLLDAINNTIVPNYMPEYAKEDGTDYTTIDEFLDVYNAKQTDDDDKITKEYGILMCISIGIDVPLTYDDVTMAYLQMSYADFINKAISDPSSVDLEAKADGTPYTETELQSLLLQAVNGDDDSGLKIKKLYTQQELEEYYNPTSQTKHNKLGSLILGGKDSKFVINKNTNVANMFGRSNLFASIVMPDKIENGVEIELPCYYSKGNKVSSSGSGLVIDVDAVTKITSDSAGKTIGLVDPVIYPSQDIPQRASDAKVDVWMLVCLGLAVLFVGVTTSLTVVIVKGKGGSKKLVKVQKSTKDKEDKPKFVKIRRL